MGAFTTEGVPIPASGPAVPSLRARSYRRRRIDPQSGRALEILSHAIEYLADEYVHQGGSLSSQDAQVEAVQLLMSANRQVYYACPEIPTFVERFKALLHLRAA
ncbi:MAG: hypothetical protein ACRD3N_05255 [Terracidiphilus sp.]